MHVDTRWEQGQWCALWSVTQILLATAECVRHSAAAFIWPDISVPFGDLTWTEEAELQVKGQPHDL